MCVCKYQYNYILNIHLTKYIDVIYIYINIYIYMNIILHYILLLISKHFFPMVRSKAFTFTHLIINKSSKQRKKRVSE